MTCLTCHDPHRIPRGKRRLSIKRRLPAMPRGIASRRKFPAAGHPASGECVTCHMPKRRTEDVVHAVMTDHLIQRRPPARDLLAEMPERHPTEAEEYHGEVVPTIPTPAADR